MTSLAEPFTTTHCLRAVLIWIGVKLLSSLKPSEALLAFLNTA
jgi:hypothetical protein